MGYRLLLIGLLLLWMNATNVKAERDFTNKGAEWSTNYDDNSGGELPIDIFASHVQGENGDIVCVDFSMTNLINAELVSFSIQFDPSVLDVICPPTINSAVWPGLTASSFACNTTDEGKINFLWFGDLTTVPDNEVAFSLCFEITGDPGTVVPICIMDDLFSDTDVEVIQGDPNDPAASCSNEEVTTHKGSVTIITNTLTIIEDHCDTSPGGTDGSITFYALGGTAPYNYDVNGGAFTGTLAEGESITLDNLPQDTYNITVTDDTGDMTTISIVVSENFVITYTLDVTNPSCIDKDNGTITLDNLDGGSPPYNISWSNFVFAVDQLDNLGPGDYTVTVSDALGCEQIQTVTLAVDTLKVTAELIAAADCEGADNGIVQLTAVGGTPFPNGGYEFNGEAPTTVQVFNNLPPGYFYFSVTDDLNCTSEIDSIFIPTLTTLDFEINKTDVSCFGAQDGSVVISTFGGSNFSFRLTDAEGNFVLGGANSPTEYMNKVLDVGCYYIEVEELATDCIGRDSFCITQPDSLKLLADIVQPTCTGNDGSIILSHMGGTGPYIFEWNDGGFETERLNLNGGNFTITLTDANGCQDSIAIDLETGGNFTLDATVVQAILCHNDMNGSITATPSSGSTSLSYEWSTSPGGSVIANTQTVEMLGAGIYYVTATEPGGFCMAEDSVILVNPEPITIDVTYTLPSCPFPEYENGSIGITPTGGISPFTFNWEDDPTGNPDLSVLGGIASGEYAVTISDDNGCMLDTILTLGEPESITLTVDNIIGTSCFQECNGSATANASGGTVDNGNYFYIWSSSPLDNGPVATNLCPGEQWVIVADESCPSDTVFFTVPEAPPISIDQVTLTEPTCFGDCDGSITITATGGNPGYTYQWMGNPLPGPTADNLCEGYHTVTITDNSNCAFVDSVYLSQPDTLIAIIDPFQTVDLSCNNTDEGQIIVIASGGNAGDYTYEWTPDISQNNRASNLGPGEYLIRVTDTKGCFDTTSYTLIQPDPVIAQVADTPLPLCFGGETCISIESFSGGSGENYTFTINQGIRYPIDSCVTVFAGPYTINVFDSEGCSTDTMIFINQPAEIQLDLGPDIELGLGQTSDPIQVDYYSLLPILDVAWSTPDSINCLDPDCLLVTVSPDQNTTYSVTISDENGCTATDELVVTISDDRNVYAANVFSPNNDGKNDYFQLVTGYGVELVDYFRIYDRWGNLVFSKDDYIPDPSGVDGWNGTYKNKPLNPAVFVYSAKVIFIDGRELFYHGTVALVK